MNAAVPAAPAPAAVAAGQSAGAAKALPDLCAKCFAYTLWLVQAPAAQQLDARTVYQRYDELLREFDGDGRRAGYEVAQVRLAMFALVAFVDELLLTSQHPVKASWSDQPLQLTYFNENSAGEEFYVRLEAARRGEGPRDLDVQEAFYLCLSLGFHGRYAGSSRAEKQRRSLMEQLAADIRSRRGASAASLSPHGLCAVAEGRSEGLRSVWAVPLAVAAILAVALITWNVLLFQIATRAATAFP
jgi:type IV/VI secretion system ImpK/VasF family protein